MLLFSNAVTISFVVASWHDYECCFCFLIKQKQIELRTETHNNLLHRY